MEKTGESLEDKKNCQRIRISVIVPVYNVEPYIRRCLDSILAQTYKNLEIILVDDGSADGSGAVCDEYAATDNRIQVIHKKNGGVVSARKAGALCATGEYTTNVDADDWIEENAYETMAAKLEEYHPDMLALGYKKEYGAFVEEYRQGIRAGFYHKDEFWEVFNRYVREMPFFTQPVDMMLWNKAIKTELYKKCQLGCKDDLGDNGDDDGVVFPCLLALESVFIMPQCFYHYCARKKSVLWNPVNGNYESCLLLAKHLITSYADHKNSARMDKNFLLYKLFYHLMLFVPYKFINKEHCVLYPRMKPGSNIVVYGKGVFANRLMRDIRQLQYCNIVDNIDKADIDRLKKLDEGRYDHVIVAIFHSSIVSSSTEFIKEQGISPDKILCIEKENLPANFLPEEVSAVWETIEGQERV